MKSRVNLIVICGSNASGKTRLGVHLAQKYNGEILSADSRQVYKGMNIGTGKDIDEYNTPKGSIPYHLIDVVEPTEIYTLYHYQRDFYNAFKNIQLCKKFPILVGGTGLYIEAVLKHYKIPNVPENPSLRDELIKSDISSLIKKLSDINPEIFSNTDTSSKKRIVRAIEVALYAKDRNIEWGYPDPPQIRPIVICVNWDRSMLHERIDKRLDDRLNNGMVEEVQNLLKSGIPTDRFSLFGMEYKYVAEYIQGNLSYLDMVKELRHAIHQLAKRQLTYFRGMERRGIAINWIPEANFDMAMEILEKCEIIG